MIARPRPRSPRRGATLVEGAIVLPVLFLLIIGLIVVGLGVYRYQQVAALAREGARFASVRGGNYAQDTGAATADQGAVDAYVKTKAAGLDPTLITCTVTWDDASKSPNYLANPATNQFRTNYVTVTVSYTWTPEALFGTQTMTSTSRMPLTN